MEIQTININGTNVTELSLSYSDNVVRMTFLDGLNEVQTITLEMTPELKNDFTILGVKAFIEANTDVVFV